MLGADEIKEGSMFIQYAPAQALIFKSWSVIVQSLVASFGLFLLFPFTCLFFFFLYFFLGLLLFELSDFGTLSKNHTFVAAITNCLAWFQGIFKFLKLSDVLANSSANLQTFLMNTSKLFLVNSVTCF